MGGAVQHREEAPIRVQVEGGLCRRHLDGGTLLVGLAGGEMQQVGHLERGVDMKAREGAGFQADAGHQSAMISLSMEDGICRKLRETALGCLVCTVEVGDSPEALLVEMRQASVALRESTPIEMIHGNDPIMGTRLAYKSLGKDPSRYRPSAEAIHRRVIQGKDLPSLGNVVDVLNLLALESGYSIGGWDLEKVSGPVALGVGKEGEPYETIGRGPMNIADLPVMRDRLGAFGNPCSDSARTQVTAETRWLLAGIYAFEGGGELSRWLLRMADLLGRYAGGGAFELKVFTAY